MFNQEDQIAVNALRSLSVSQIERANSGHPGLPLGAAPMAYALFSDHLTVDPMASSWINRDRFVLSAGHGSALLYSLLHLSGFNITIDDLRQFRQYGSKTPGHPEFGWTDGVEATTGPLGQGIAQAVGMATAEAHLRAVYNEPGFPVIDHYTYTLVGDGDLMEGVAYEATSFAGRQQLDRLIVLYDSNDISLDGELAESFSENIQTRFEAMNWHYLRVEDSNDLQAITDAIQKAKTHIGQPTLIEIKTIIGYGSPKAGTNAVHGAPLGEDDWNATKEHYNWTEKDFVVPEAVYQRFKEKVSDRGRVAHEDWKKNFERYKQIYPEKANQLEQAFDNVLPDAYDSELHYVDVTSESDATRNVSGKTIQALANKIPYFWGGSADLSSSNKTLMKNVGDFFPETPEGRNLWFGVREFAMAAMMNGILLHGGTKGFVSTFFVFSDYLKAAVRLSALSKIPTIYVMTHDSIAVGEDGPTHEPIEQLAAFRAMPDLDVIRPADENETIAAWKLAVQSTNQPTMLVLTRQNVPVLPFSKEFAEEGVKQGGYIISAAQGSVPEGILIASGSEVSLAIDVQKALQKEGIDVSVVSMPSMHRFNAQDKAYQDKVLPPSVRNRMSIELSATEGWHRYVGLDGVAVGIDRFGASGPAEVVIPAYGFTVDQIVSMYQSHFE